jgi:hypothetical protein
MAFIIYRVSGWKSGRILGAYMKTGVIELIIIFVIAAAAAAFITRRIIKTFHSKRPPCCSGEGIPKKIDKEDSL